MAREIVNPTTDERGEESHPSWVLVGASRVSAGPPGQVLFDSDIRHQHYVSVRVRRASRKRDLHHDWKHGRETIVEFSMSEAQWASFVSSMNSGDGVPATLKFDATQDNPLVPGMPYAPRLQNSMDEVRGAAARAQADVLTAFEAYKEHKTVGNLRSLEAAIANMPANLSFTAKSLSEHAENVVQRAQADIEAMVVNKAQQLGIDPAELGKLELTTGEEQ